MQLSRKNIVIWLVLIVVYFITRLARLDLIPIFTDEAIYLRWSQIMVADTSYKYLPLTDGKPPLFMWLTAVVMRAIPSLDPLLIGRLVSVGAGFLAMLGIYFAAQQVFRNKKISHFAAILYLICPFTFFYDRFGLVDALLAMWGVWSLGLGVLLVKSRNLAIACTLGVIIGLGLLTKTPAIFFLLYLPLLLVFFDFKEPKWKLELGKLIALFLLVALISLGIFSLLTLLPQHHLISEKNSQFVISFGEFLREPLKLFFGNLKALILWQRQYFAPSLTIVLFLSLLTGIVQKSKEKLVLLGYFAIHLLFMALFNKVIYPRFLLVFTPMLLILIAVGFAELGKAIKTKILLYALYFLAFLLPAYTDFVLLTDPPSAPIADNDSFHYLNGWPAGFGVKEVRDFLASESLKSSKMVLVTEGTFGLMPYALELYQKDYPNLEIKSLWPPPDNLPKDLLETSSNFPTYYLIYQRDKTPGGGRLELVREYRQGKGVDLLRLYRVLPPLG